MAPGQIGPEGLTEEEVIRNMISYCQTQSRQKPTKMAPPQSSTTRYPVNTTGSPPPNGYEATPPTITKRFGRPKPFDEEAAVLSFYGPADRRMIFLDYDGTLTEIVKNPKDAIIPEIMLDWLKTLASEPKNRVWIISGRPQDFLEAQLGKFNHIGLVAEHGAFMRRPGYQEWENVAADVDLSWQAPIKDAFDAFEKKHQGMVNVEQKKAALVLHYRQAQWQDIADMDAIDLKDDLQHMRVNYPVEIISGKCIIEARPSGINKGEIVRKIMAEAKQETGSPQFVLCVGDDVTDEGEYLPP